MKVENVHEVLEFYGADTVLLVGGSLLDAPNPSTLLARSRDFVAAAAQFTYRR
jgi:hypothetical protein